MMSGMCTVGVSQKRAATRKKRKEFFWFELDLWSKRRNWSEFIHEFIGCHWVGPCRSKEIGDVVIGVTKVLSSVGKGLLDS